MIFSLFSEKHSKLLPIFFQPAKDELFSSWLTRLAHQHYQEVSVFTRLALPGFSICKRDIDRLASLELLQELAQRTNTPIAILQQTLLRSYEGKLFSQYRPTSFIRWVKPADFFHRSVKSYGLAFCPQCLQKDGQHPYFRKQWRISLYTICPDCGDYLQNSCPECGSPLIFFQRIVPTRSTHSPNPITTCFLCRFNLVNSPIHQAPKKYYQVQLHFHRILGNESNETLFHPPSYLDTAYHLTCLILASSYLGKSIRKKSKNGISFT